MTSPSPPASGPSTVRTFAITHRSVLTIAVPMTLASLSTPLIGLVATAVIGQLGQAPLIGGIAVGAVIFDCLFMTLGFLRSATTGLTAQALGAEDDCEQRATLIRAVLVGVAAGLAILVFSEPILAAALLFMGASAEVSVATSEYYRVRVLSAPFVLANFAILGWYVGLGRAGIGLLLQALLGGLNTLLSAIFVLVLGWGVVGVAGAAVVAEGVTAMVGAALVMHRIGRRPGLRLAGIFDRARILRMMVVNRDIMIRSFALLFAFAFFTAQGAKAGDVTLAANAILMNFFLVGGYFLDGFASAAQQLAGRAVGARYRPAFDQAVGLTMGWGFALALLLAALFWFAGGRLIDLMTTSEAVRAAARSYLVWAALTPLAGVLAFQMDGVFIGATWSGDMRNMMLVSLALYLAVWWLASPALGNHGLWLALVVFLGARGLTLLWRCRRRARVTFAVA